MSSQRIRADEVGFHSGELAAQRRAGVEDLAARLEPMMAPGELRGGAPAFVANASFAAITARDRDGRLWTSPLVGPRWLHGGDDADATVDPQRAAHRRPAARAPRESARRNRRDGLRRQTTRPHQRDVGRNRRRHARSGRRRRHTATARSTSILGGSARKTTFPQPNPMSSAALPSVPTTLR